MNTTPNQDLSLVVRAAAFAAHRHGHQKRKGKDKLPYITHPLEVARILIEEAGEDDPAVIAAAILHDTVEDAGVTVAELTERFGGDVAAVVLELTDDKLLPKEERKRLQIVNARGKSVRAAKVKMADKIANLRDVANDPPTDWDEARKRKNFDWSHEVVSALPNVSPRLAAIFEETYARIPAL
jgi:guanosine-3',5'-bis(diphosphate) 3'-pyrophosphohydrolase